jgi:RNase P subunit RPR2
MKLLQTFRRRHCKRCEATSITPRDCFGVLRTHRNDEQAMDAWVKPARDGVAGDP